MTSGALVQVGRPPATRGFDGAAVPKERFDPEPPWTPEERRVHVQGRSEPHRLQAECLPTCSRYQHHVTYKPGLRELLDSIKDLC